MVLALALPLPPSLSLLDAETGVLPADGSFHSGRDVVTLPLVILLAAVIECAGLCASQVLQLAPVLILYDVLREFFVFWLVLPLCAILWALPLISRHR